MSKTNMIRYPFYLWGSFVVVLLMNCAAPTTFKEPKENEAIQKFYANGESYQNLDVEFATYLSQGNLGLLMKKSNNLLALVNSTTEEKLAANFWRDVALLFMGVEVEQESAIYLGTENERARWTNLPPELQFSLTQKLIQELNNNVKKVDDSKIKKSKVRKLRRELKALTLKQKKLEQLLNDLENVK